MQMAGAERCPARAAPASHDRRSARKQDCQSGLWLPAGSIISGARGQCYEEPNWQRVAELVRKYGQPGLPVDAIRKALKDWIALDAKMEQGALTAASFD